MRASLLLLSSSVGLPSPSLAVPDVAAPWKASPDVEQGQKFGRLLDRRRRSVNMAQEQSRDTYATKKDGKKVMPWISIVLLLKILFFFRSFASPFFDPLGYVSSLPYTVSEFRRFTSLRTNTSNLNRISVTTCESTREPRKGKFVQNCCSASINQNIGKSCNT